MQEVLREELKPINENVVIRAIKIEKTTKSGIVLADTKTNVLTHRGEVLASDSDSMKKGDNVIFNHYGSQKIYSDEEIYITKAKNVLVIIS